MITKEQKTIIVDLWNKGYDGTKIADALCLTRNTVLGTVHRLRKQGIPLEERKGMTGFKVKKARPLIIRKPRKVVPKVATKVVLIEPVVKADHRKPTNLMGLKYNSCRFIVEQGTVETTKYCNAKIDRNSYCTEHYKICYVPPRRAIEGMISAGK